MEASMGSILLHAMTTRLPSRPELTISGFHIPLSGFDIRNKPLSNIPSTVFIGAFSTAFSINVKHNLSIIFTDNLSSASSTTSNSLPSGTGVFKTTGKQGLVPPSVFKNP